MAKFNFLRIISDQKKLIKFKILDVIAPVTSWVALNIYHKYWASNLAHKTVKSWDKTTKISKKISNRWNAIHQPENWLQSVVLAIAIVFIPQFLLTFWFVSPFCSNTIDYGWRDNNSVSVLGTSWQVTAGLISITFVIIIFIVEYANRGRYEQRALPIFFAETRMLFTASFGILVILSTGITSLFLSKYEFRTDYLSCLFYWQWILFVLNIWLILKIFFQTIRILTKPYFKTKLKDYNHRIANKLVETELIYRVMSNMSVQVLKESGINIPYFEPDLFPSDVVVTIPNLPRQIQRVIDINLKLVEIAHQQAKIFFPGIQESDIVFYAKIGHRIAAEKPSIAKINPNIDHPAITAYLKRCIRISNDKHADKSRITDEVFLIRDVILHAVQDQDSETVKDLLNHYEDILEAFLQTTGAYGIYFTQESASKIARPFSDWKLVSTIVDQYQSLIPTLLEISDFEMTARFLRFPVDMMGLAIQYRDHLIYQQFAELYPLIYFRSRELLNSKQKDKVIENFEHLLIDHRRFILAPSLKYINSGVQQLSEFRPYFKDLLVIWNRLLKASIDDRSDKRFSEFSHEVRRLVDDFFPDINETRIRTLEIRLEHRLDSPSRDANFEQHQLEKSVLKEKLGLVRFTQRMFLGLGGWITHLLEKDRITKDEYFKLIPAVNRFFRNLDQLYQAYVKGLEEEKEEYIFNWISWERSEWPTMYGDVGSGSSTYSSWLDKYFLVRLIEILPYNINPFPRITPSYQSKVVYDIVVKMSEEICNDDLWLEVFRSADIDHLEERVSVIREIFSKAKTQQEILEEQNVIDSQLDSELINSFKTEVVSIWEKSALIRKLVNQFGRYREIYNDQVLKTLTVIGIFELAPKEAFIKQNRVAYVGIGESYGHGLASYEDITLGNQFKIADPISLKQKSFGEGIIQKIAEMVKLDLSPIIFYNGESIFEEFTQSEHYIPAWQTQNNPLGDIAIEGLFSHTPVIANAGLPENSIFLLDIYKFGILTQYKLQKEDTLPISLQIELLTNEKAQEIVDKNPTEWSINPETGETEDRDSGIRRILQHVNLRIGEYCRFEEINPNAICSFSFDGRNNDLDTPQGNQDDAE